MKLWVDDIRNAPDESWTVARTVVSAIRALARWDFDEISLDHDISHQVVMGSMSRPYRCDECFCAVAHFIAQKHWHEVEGPAGTMISRLNVVPKITMHTSNPVGADEMKAILKDAGIESTIKLTGAANRLEMETYHP